MIYDQAMPSLQKALCNSSKINYIEVRTRII